MKYNAATRVRIVFGMRGSVMFFLFRREMSESPGYPVSGIREKKPYGEARSSIKH